MNLPVPAYDVERIDRALSAFTTQGREAALNTMRTSRANDFNVVAVSTSPFAEMAKLC